MKTEEVKAVLLLGSNLGNSSDHINKALALIEKLAGKILLKSSVYETSPWGYADQPDFLNQVIVIETLLSPHWLLEALKIIEKELGRAAVEKWRERIIDIDILFYNELTCKTEELIIPHPFLHKRRFTLEPLAEILPGFIHPVLKKTIKELLEACEDKGAVKRLKPDFLKL